jgi:hypothetical protein
MTMNCRGCGTSQAACAALGRESCCGRCATGKTMHHKWGESDDRNPASDLR